MKEVNPNKKWKYQFTSWIPTLKDQDKENPQEMELVTKGKIRSYIDRNVN